MLRQLQVVAQLIARQYMEWVMTKSMQWNSTLANIVRNILVEVSIGVTMKCTVTQEKMVMLATDIISDF